MGTHRTDEQSLIVCRPCHFIAAARVDYKIMVSPNDKPDRVNAIQLKKQIRCSSVECEFQYIITHIALSLSLSMITIALY